MGNFIPFSATAGTNAYGVLYHPDTNSYYRPSSGLWVAWVSQAAHAVTATYIRASRYILTIPGIGADRLDIDARIYIRAGGVGAEATTDTEIYQASFDWRGLASYPVSPYSTPPMAVFSLGQNGADVVLGGVQGGNFPSDFADLAGMVLTNPLLRSAWRVTSYNDDTGVLAASPIGHSTTLFSIVATTPDGWTLSREAFLPATPPTGYGATPNITRGPLALVIDPSADGNGKQSETLYVGERPTLRVAVVDKTGSPVPLSGTVTASFTNMATGASVATVAGTLDGTSTGQADFVVPAAVTNTGLAGARVKLTVSFTSGGQTQIAGAATLEIAAV